MTSIIFAIATFIFENKSVYLLHVKCTVHCIFFKCFLDIKEKSTALEESYLETSELNIENESPQDEAYDQAVEFIKLTNKLESAPTLLDEQFRRLQELKSEVSKSINKLKESSEALQS